MHKVNTYEVHVLHAKCKKNFIFLWKFSKFYILPHVCLLGNINFLIIWVQLSFIVFPSCNKLGTHMTYLCGWFHKILLKLRKII